MAGSPFGKYLLYERIAAGGMAEIYRAKYAAAAGVTKQVVIKKILPHYAGNRNFVSMFINEAKIAIGLSHGNIAQVFDFGEIDGEYFLAMEYVHGQTVSKILRRAREKSLNVPPPYAAFIAMEMSRGLHYAHTRVDETQQPLRIVHRDISPQNVIVSYEGEVKLVDFGIAKARSASDADKTQAGAIKGKYVYFSPEQARARDLDGRSDVFATGICLYEMVCGRLPFEGKMVEVLNRIVRGDFPRPSTVSPDVDAQLEAIILKSMATDREDRYATSLAMQEALAGYLIGIAPRFNQSSLAQLVDFLFADELAMEGREVNLPTSFLSQVNRWKDEGLTRAPAQATRAAPQEPQDMTSAERRSRRSIVPAPQELSEPGPQLTRTAFRPGRAGLFAAVGIFVATAGLGGGAMVYLGRARTFAVEARSEPPGAEVVVDGSPTGEHTPVTLPALDADRPHVIELRVAGMKPWSQPVQPVRGQTVQVDAHLEPELLGPRTTPAGATSTDDGARDEAPPGPPNAPLPTWPQAELRLDAQVAAIAVPATRAARARLNPKATYKLTAEGAATLDDASRTRGCFWFADLAPGAGGPSFGFIGPRDTVKLAGARVLYAFVVDPAPQDNAGVIELVAREGKNAVRLAVDAQRNAIFPETNRGGRFAGLGGKGRFQLELSGRAGLGQGSGDRAAFWAQAQGDARKGGDANHGVLKTGDKVVLENPAQIVLFLPDDDPTDNSGALTATLRKK